MTDLSTLPRLDLLIAAPPGFLRRSSTVRSEIVELALIKYGAPVYVRHEIVHNKYVVDDLKAKGAIFVEELDEVPDGVPVVFSAHGVPKAIPDKASERGLSAISTRPARSSRRSHRRRPNGWSHRTGTISCSSVTDHGHPEVIGTFGQVPERIDDPGRNR